MGRDKRTYYARAIGCMLVATLWLEETLINQWHGVWLKRGEYDYYARFIGCMLIVVLWLGVMFFNQWHFIWLRIVLSFIITILACVGLFLSSPPETDQDHPVSFNHTWDAIWGIFLGLFCPVFLAGCLSSQWSVATNATTGGDYPSATYVLQTKQGVRQCSSWWVAPWRKVIVLAPPPANPIRLRIPTREWANDGEVCIDLQILPIRNQDLNPGLVKVYLQEYKEPKDIIQTVYREAKLAYYASYERLHGAGVRDNNLQCPLNTAFKEGMEPKGIREFKKEIKKWFEAPGSSILGFRVRVSFPTRYIVEECYL